MKTGFFVAFVCATIAFGQADFESQLPVCGYMFPIGCGSPGDPEGVSRSVPSGLGIGWITIDTANAIGMPCSGLRYARITANGPLLVVPHGPMPVLPGLASQLFIPVPAGANSVTFCWDFYLVGQANNSFLNDGMSIDLIGPCGTAPLANFAYADAFSPLVGPGDVGSPCASGGLEFLPGGTSQSVIAAPIPPGVAFLRVSVWNGGDNSTPSHGVIDGVTFTVGIPGCTLSFTSPFGIGSVMMNNTPCAVSVGLDYFTAVDLTVGAFPGGWFFGIDISFPELLTLFTLGPPFTGTLDAAGASTTGVIGPFPTLSGLTLSAVTTEWAPGFVALVRWRPAVLYTIP